MAKKKKATKKLNFWERVARGWKKFFSKGWK
jgi:hypothetical protein